MHNDSPFRLVLWVFNKEVKIVLALFIYLSHTPPILLAEGGFCFHSIHSPSLSLMKSFISCWSISAKALLNSEGAPTKLLPLSDLKSLMFPLQPICKRRFLTQPITWERCHLLLQEASCRMSACDTLQNIGSQCSIIVYDPETRRSDVVHCNASSRVCYLLMAPSDDHYSNFTFSANSTGCFISSLTVDF